MYKLSAITGTKSRHFDPEPNPLSGTVWTVDCSSTARPPTTAPDSWSEHGGAVCTLDKHVTITEYVKANVHFIK